MKKTCKWYLPLLLCAPGYLPAAPPVYKWVDESGATHYSETRPEADIAGLEVLEVTSRPVNTVPAGDFRTTLEVANSMQAGRLERERLRLEKLKLEQARRQARLDAQRFDEAYRSAYYYGPVYGYRHRHYRKRHDHGGHRSYPRPIRGDRPPPGSYPGGSVPKRAVGLAR